MRTLLVAAVLLHLGSAVCDWHQQEKQLAGDRKSDRDNHGCRACKTVPVSADACPESGYECKENWSLTTKVLTVADCSCAEARCADEKARLAVNGVMTDKLRCNNSRWTVGLEGTTVAESVICAKYCDTPVCKDRHMDASPDYYPLPIQAGNAETKCAFAQCEHGISALNEDGTFDHAVEADTATCSSDGRWRVGEEEKQEYLMCNSPPCGPTVCRNSHPDAIGLLPLTVNCAPGECAMAKCEGGFVQLNAIGSVVGPITGVDHLDCKANGKWSAHGGAEYTSVMCAQPQEEKGQSRA
ncbi:hypothetical protein PFISCL1PPCAC_9402 [Pristionchus fissidentatus]|uniref:Uncharacterized protein n=1 Tax=Pristionchus fissidentatus TaxID=1538716 RepID=A0AAV5VJJ7_9BILA|nr:hypothetical protein PFISCL1PPCAC_9402 [Pristionchus fissidentatus]